MKRCPKCGETKERSEFQRQSSSRDGLQYQCGSCNRESQKKRGNRLKNRTEEELQKAREAKPFKKCGRCKEVLESEKNFTKDPLRLDGWKSICKTCSVNHTRKWTAENRERFRVYQSEYFKRDEVKVKLSARQAKRRVRKRGTLTEWDLKLSAQWRKVISEMPCYYCGTTDADSYHVDHRIPVSKGGDDSWVNLVRACESCNLSKSAKTDAEFFGWNEEQHVD